VVGGGGTFDNGDLLPPIKPNRPFVKSRGWSLFPRGFNLLQEVQFDIKD